MTRYELLNEVRTHLGEENCDMVKALGNEIVDANKYSVERAARLYTDAVSKLRVALGVDPDDNTNEQHGRAIELLDAVIWDEIGDLLNDMKQARWARVFGEP